MGAWKDVTLATHLRSTTCRNHTIIIHDVRAREPRIGDDAWTEGSERDGHTRTPEARRNLIKRQKTFEST